MQGLKPLGKERLPNEADRRLRGAGVFECDEICDGWTTRIA